MRTKGRSGAAACFVATAPALAVVALLGSLAATTRALSASGPFPSRPRSRSARPRPTSAAVALCGGTGDAAAEAGSTPAAPSTTANPFLPLLSGGLRRASVAMRKDTSDRVFKSSPSLNRLRRQVQQLTRVGPSSLGEHAGLGLFATKNVKAGTVVGLYPAHALGYELLYKPAEEEGADATDLSMFLAESDDDERYFAEHPHGTSPYLHATDQPLYRRPSLIAPLFDEGKDEMAPPLYLDVNPRRNGELDPIWTSHYINDGTSLLEMQEGGATIEESIVQYYTQSTRAKNCIHIPFGPSPILATVTTKKVKKGQELYTSYGVVYWLGAIDAPDEDAPSAPGMTEAIQSQIVESARDLQKAMEEAKRGYETEMGDLETAVGALE